MKNEPLPTYPELEPDIALFSMFELYEMQRAPIRREHAKKLQQLKVASAEAIKLYQLELIERDIGLDNPPEGFEEIHELLEDTGDNQIADRIDEQRDRILTLMSHYALATRKYTHLDSLPLPDTRHIY
jgi:hypothetical protein